MDLLSIFGFVGKVLDKIIPDPQARAAAQLKLAELQQGGELARLKAETDLAIGQQNINLEEAKSASLFVSGWRPAVGWCCCAALFYEFLLRPLAVAFSLPAPELPMGDLLTILGGLLGLGHFRTKEKIVGVAAK